MRLKHRPVQDVAAGGGWQSAEVVRYIYQQAEAALTREVMMDADPRNESTNVRTNVRTGPRSAEVAEVEEASKPA